MKALSSHLRPAPYPYGLLTLRLLGKLGGKNRGFLREPIDICDPACLSDASSPIRVACTWVTPEPYEFEARGPVGSTSAKENISKAAPTNNPDDNQFSLPLPLDRCVEVLKLVALSEESEFSERTATCQDQNGLTSFSWKESKKLWNVQIEKVDLLPYCMDVMEETKNGQVEAAIRVLHSLLVPIIGVNEFKVDSVDFVGHVDATNDADDETVTVDEMHAASSNVNTRNRQLRSIGLGLMYGCAIESIHERASILLKGLFTHLFLMVTSHDNCFRRIDANGSCIAFQTSSESIHPQGHDDIFEEGLGSLKPFGYFEQTGVLRYRANPMALNISLAEFLSEQDSRAKKVALAILSHILQLPSEVGLNQRGSKQESTVEETISLDRMDRGSLIFFENLLGSLCEKCITSKWNRRGGIYEGICVLIESLGSDWGRKYEMEIMNAALFAVKSSPREMSASAVEAFRFLVRVCEGLYGTPKYKLDGDGNFLWDILDGAGGKEEPGQTSERSEGREHDSDRASIKVPCDDVLQILINEMANVKQIVRYVDHYFAIG